MTAPAKWTPTSELRWHEQEVTIGLTIYDRSTLQQKWTNGRKSEWRDVPKFINTQMKVEPW
jgi:hypothetical protein